MGRTITPRRGVWLGSAPLEPSTAARVTRDGTPICVITASHRVAALIFLNHTTTVRAHSAVRPFPLLILFHRLAVSHRCLNVRCDALMIITRNIIIYQSNTLKILKYSVIRNKNYNYLIFCTCVVAPRRPPSLHLLAVRSPRCCRCSVQCISSVRNPRVPLAHERFDVGTCGTVVNSAHTHGAELLFALETP